MLGEDIGAAGGVFKTTEGLLARFGPDRVRDTPISEQAIIGAAMGAAMTGLRPVAELMFSDFFGVAWDMVANQIAKTRYMTDGQVTLPLVIRTANGGGLRFGAQHSQSIETWAMAIPGLKVVAPSTPADVVGLMAAAIRDPDPVIFCEHKALLADKARCARRRARRRARCGAGRPRRDRCHRRRAGRHGAAVRWPRPRRWPAEGIIARGHRPALARAARHDDGARIGRARRSGCSPWRRTRGCAGWGAEVVSIVAEEAIYDLDGPVVRITTPHVPLAANPVLEDAQMPSAERIAETVRTHPRGVALMVTVAVVGTRADGLGDGPLPGARRGAT